MRTLFIVPCLTALCGCASMASVRVEPPARANSSDFHYIRNVPPVAQTAYQCGPAALESAIRHWGRQADAAEIGRALTHRGSRGVLNFTLAQYARDLGLWTEIREGNPAQLRLWLEREIPPIVMLHAGPFWSPTYHFIVVSGFNDPEQIFYANIGYPQKTRAIRYPDFFKRWRQAGAWTLILCPPERVDWELAASQAADLGFLLERSRRLDLAQRWYRAALAKEPSNVPVRFNLANVYLKTNRLKQARALYQELVKEKPDWAPAANNLAWIYLGEGHPGEALRVIEAAFQAGAQRGYDILDTLGLAYCRVKQYRKAETALLEALQKVPPGNPETESFIRAHLNECRAPQ